MKRTTSDRSLSLRSCMMASCQGTRSNLVHKFPMDNMRSEMWRTIINHPQINNLSMDVIRRRYFICSRHFRPQDYKHAESRSLNVTALPSLLLHRYSYDTDSVCEEELEELQDETILVTNVDNVDEDFEPSAICKNQSKSLNDRKDEHHVSNQKITIQSNDPEENDCVMYLTFQNSPNKSNDLKNAELKDPDSISNNFQNNDHNNLSELSKDKNQELNVEYVDEEFETIGDGKFVFIFKYTK